MPMPHFIFLILHCLAQHVILHIFLYPKHLSCAFHFFWPTADFRRDLLICEIRIFFHCLKYSPRQNQSFLSSLLFCFLLLHLDIFLIAILCNQHVLNLASFPFQVIHQYSTVNTFPNRFLDCAFFTGMLPHRINKLAVFSLYVTFLQEFMRLIGINIDNFYL